MWLLHLSLPSHWFVLSWVIPRRPGLIIEIHYWIKLYYVGKQESRQEYKSLKTNPPTLVSIHPSSYTWMGFLLFYSSSCLLYLIKVCKLLAVRYSHFISLWQPPVSISQCPDPSPASACVTLPAAWEQPYFASYHLWMGWILLGYFEVMTPDSSPKETDSAKIITNASSLINVRKENLNGDYFRRSHLERPFFKEKWKMLPKFKCAYSTCI